MLSSYSRMLMVSRAHVLSASRPDFRDIITRQASGVPGIKTMESEGKKNGDQTLNDKKVIEHSRSVFIDGGAMDRQGDCLWAR